MYFFKILNEKKVIKSLPCDDFANAVYSLNKDIFENNKEPPKAFLEDVK